MGPILVVVSAPTLQLFGRVGKRQEPVGVQALGPEAAVKGLDEGVIRGLAGPREVQGDAKVAGDELRALVDPDSLGEASLALARSSAFTTFSDR